jgi:hypothetical protein
VSWSNYAQGFFCTWTSDNIIRMSTMPSKVISAAVLGVSGVGLITYSVLYSVSHIDSYLDLPSNFSPQVAFPVGILLVLLVPLVLRRLKLFFVLLLMAGLYILWSRSN